MYPVEHQFIREGISIQLNSSGGIQLLLLRFEHIAQAFSHLQSTLYVTVMKIVLKTMQWQEKISGSNWDLNPGSSDF